MDKFDIIITLVFVMVLVGLFIFLHIDNLNKKEACENFGGSLGDNGITCVKGNNIYKIVGVESKWYELWRGYEIKGYGELK